MNSINAQTSLDSLNYNAFSFNVGMNQLKEENIHPKVHTGSIFTLSYNRYIKKKNASLFDVTLAYSRMKTGFESVSSSLNTSLYFSYNYLFELSKGKINYLYGPKICIDYNFSYYPNWDDSHLYWSNHASIGIQNKISYSISSNRIFICDFGVALLSVFSRPPAERQYKIDDLSFRGIMENFHSNPEVGTLFRSIDINYKMEYQFKLSSEFAQSLFYSYRYKMLNSEIAEMFQNNIHTIGLKIYFL